MSAVVNLKSSIIKNLSRFSQNPLNSDVILEIGNDRIPAHRFVLAANSNFFQNILYGERDNVPATVNLRNMDEKIVKILLKFMYTGTLNFSRMEFDDVLVLLHGASRFQLSEAEDAISDYVHRKINTKNVVAVLSFPLVAGRTILQDKARFILEMAIEGICQVERLWRMPLLKVLDQESRKVSEMKLLREILKHRECLTQEEKQSILSKVQFSKLTLEQLIMLCVPKEIIPLSALVAKSKEFCLHKGKKRVGKYSLEAAVVLTGDGKEFIFESGKNFTTHAKGSSILVDLGALYIANNIHFNIQDQNSYIAQYCIEVSMDQQIWISVRGTTDAWCFGNQTIVFPQIICRYLKITGVDMVLCHGHLTIPQETFQMNALEIGYETDPPKSIGGLIYPENNVALPPTAQAFCSTWNDEVRCDNTLLSGYYLTDDAIPWYTAQVIADGPLMIAFKQPYILDSCRFRLWDYDGRRYGYKIEVYNDGVYEVVADRSKKLMDGWQMITFTPRVVSQFRIWGTKCSHGNELRLINFLTPSQVNSCKKRKRE